MTYDYSEHMDQPTNEEFAKLNDLCRSLQMAQADIDKYEKALKSAQKVFRDLSEVRIPGVMAEIGLEEFKTDFGLKVAIAKKVRASIAKERQPTAFGWLDANGHGGMIKRHIVVDFGKEDEEQASSLLNELTKNMGFENAKQERSVHSGTLSAWVKRRLEAGEEVPESITVFEHKMAKIG